MAIIDEISKGKPIISPPDPEPVGTRKSVKCPCGRVHRVERDATEFKCWNACKKVTIEPDGSAHFGKKPKESMEVDPRVIELGILNEQILGALKVQRHVLLRVARMEGLPYVENPKWKVAMKGEAYRSLFLKRNQEEFDLFKHAEEAIIMCEDREKVLMDEMCHFSAVPAEVVARAEKRMTLLSTKVTNPKHMINAEKPKKEELPAPKGLLDVVCYKCNHQSKIDPEDKLDNIKCDNCKQFTLLEATVDNILFADELQRKKQERITDGQKVDSKEGWCATESEREALGQVEEKPLVLEAKEGLEAVAQSDGLVRGLQGGQAGGDRDCSRERTGSPSDAGTIQVEGLSDGGLPKEKLSVKGARVVKPKVPKKGRKVDDCGEWNPEDH